ncbi:MAG TPA: hypothetical protein PLD57_01960 [Aggregatilineales bacterium]|nr:hypothetical protein [Aggregatilineales bacterium]HQE18448.1 hypothetical protein [Aggregatilineales bacterium]
MTGLSYSVDFLKDGMLVITLLDGPQEVNVELTYDDAVELHRLLGRALRKLSEFSMNVPDSGDTSSMKSKGG